MAHLPSCKNNAKRGMICNRHESPNLSFMILWVEESKWRLRQRWAGKDFVTTPFRREGIVMKDRKRAITWNVSSPSAESIASVVQFRREMCSALHCVSLRLNIPKSFENMWLHRPISAQLCAAGRDKSGHLSKCLVAWEYVAAQRVIWGEALGSSVQKGIKTIMLIY